MASSVGRQERLFYFATLLQHYYEYNEFINKNKKQTNDMKRGKLL